MHNLLAAPLDCSPTPPSSLPAIHCLAKNVLPLPCSTTFCQNVCTTSKTKSPECMISMLRFSSLYSATNMSPSLDMCMYSVCCEKAVVASFSICIAYLLSVLHSICLQSEQCHHILCKHLSDTTSHLHLSPHLGNHPPCRGANTHVLKSLAVCKCSRYANAHDLQADCRLCQM